VRQEILKTENAARIETARKAIQEAMALMDEAVELGMESGQAEVLLQKAIAASDAGEHGKAMTFTRQLEEHVKDERAKLPAKMEKGFKAAAELIAKEKIGPEDIEKARMYLSGAVVFYEKTGESRRLAEAYERFGLLEERLGKIAYSKSLYQKAVNTYFKMGEIDQVLTILVEKLKRLEAISDKNVAECAIEELFLIYRDGRLIHHNTRRLRPEVDNQLLGGMLIAIQHFVADSFKEKEPERPEILNELRYGKTRILVEAGKFVYLALVISGQEPEDMRTKMRKAVADIEEKYRPVLEGWNGDASKLWGAKKMVEPLISGL
jgi:tetratricopeptide (TPR) repeat protein